jgi:lysozyme family protein
MTDRFPLFIDRLLSHEGGYTNDARDPGNWTGGRVGVGQLKGTKFGIAANTYPNLDIKNLTRDQAIAIYRRDFWAAAKCDKLAPVVAFQLLDGAVNSGIAQATRWLQRAVKVADDGMIGAMTLAAIRATDGNDIAYRFNADRIEFMTRLKNWKVHGAGWMRRIASNLRFAAEDN